MGSCVSSHRKSSEMKSVFWFNRKSKDEEVIPPSPIKENQIPIINGNVAVKPQMPPRVHSTANSRDFGSKEETFFDSQAWLESDCESDFMSVNGEFTPSRGNTPMHHDFTTGTPPIKGGAFTADDEKPSMTPSASPIRKKKRLSELFSESLRENRNHDEENGEPATENGAAVRAGDSKPPSKRERWVETVQVQSCLPRVLSSCRPVTSHQTQVRRK